MNYILFFLIILTSKYSYGQKSQQDFTTLNQFAESIFRSEVLKTGCRNFEIMGHYELNYFAASAERDDKDDSCLISVLGGYYLAKDLGEAAHLLVLCHELGHFLGNGPKKVDEFGHDRWSNVEGEADYFSTKTCLKKLLLTNQTLISRLLGQLKAEASIQKICQTQASILDQNICTLTIMGSFQKLQLEQFWVMPPARAWDMKSATEALLHPSTEVVDHTHRGSTDYPTDQCRFDTLVAGATNQARPACWFRDELNTKYQQVK